MSMGIVLATEYMAGHATRPRSYNSYPHTSPHRSADKEFEHLMNERLQCDYGFISEWSAIMEV
jgi:hypothetical protein